VTLTIKPDPDGVKMNSLISFRLKVVCPDTHVDSHSALIILAA